MLFVVIYMVLKVKPSMCSQRVRRQYKDLRSDFIMKMNFETGKTEMKNRFNLFVWCVSKGIYRKGDNVPLLSDMKFDKLEQVCLRYYKGYSVNLTPIGIRYLEEKLEESTAIYNDFLSLVDKYCLLEARLW